MNTESQRRDQESTRREPAHRPAQTRRVTADRAWKRPDFTEISACAEISAYVFTG